MAMGLRSVCTFILRLNFRRETVKLTWTIQPFDIDSIRREFGETDTMVVVKLVRQMAFVAKNDSQKNHHH